jgi:hypothetical protein
MTMQTVTIEVDNAHALKMLEELEALSLIRVIKKTIAKERKGNLSERLSGSISSQQADLMRKELNEMRNGWERNI